MNLSADWLSTSVIDYCFFGYAGPDLAGFLLSPFRKPKRVRTAFSPSQLLKLEHAFEKNHYVVGAERKQLAQTLNLTETQVRSCQSSRMRNAVERGHA